MALETKICGLSTAETLDLAVAEGAALVGFNFFPRSPRYVSIPEAAALAARVRPGVRRVAVLVDPSDDFLAELAARVPLELLQLHGDWLDAIAEAQRAAEWSARKAVSSDTGAACYQQGELHRLRGEFDRADEWYRRANQAGRKPNPGFALLRLAQGQIDAADAACRRMLVETSGPRARALVLGTYRLHLQPTEPGWFDLALKAPLINCTRARSELDWAPQYSSADALLDLLSGIRAKAGMRTGPLEPAQPHP